MKPRVRYRYVRKDRPSGAGSECLCDQYSARYGPPLPAWIRDRSYADHRDDCPIYQAGHLEMIRANHDLRRTPKCKACNAHIGSRHHRVMCK